MRKSSEKQEIIENVIEEHLTKRCEELDIFVLKNTGRRGIPDRLLIKNGKHYFIELKRPGKKATELQKEIHKRLKKHGATVFVIDNKDDIDKVLESM